MLQRIIRFIFLPKFLKLDKKIGYKLLFRNIPSRFIDGWVEWDMTSTFRKFGLDIKEGANYWTIGNVINGISSRFDRNAPEYQSWLGGYLVRFPAKQAWTVEDHFSLAIADQNSWLRTYGDPKPMTSIEGCEFVKLGPISAGKYSGVLYEGSCLTHSDVGEGSKPWKFRIESNIIAGLFKLSNPKLNLKGSMMRPKKSDLSYETLKLRGYIAIFDVEEKVKVVLYGNGAVIKKNEGNIDTFLMLKNDLLAAMQSCEIIKV